MHKFILWLVFLIGSHNCLGQIKFNPEIEVGLSIPTGSLVSKVYQQGLMGSAGVSFNVWKGLSVKPAFQYRIYTNQLESEIIESLRIQSFLGSIAYTVIDKEEIKLKPEIGVGHGAFINLWKVTLPDGKEVTEDMMEGNDLFVDIGVSFYYKRFYAKCSYQWFEAIPTFDPEIQRAVTDHPSLYELDFIVDRRLNMNNFSITLGFRFL